MYLFTFNIGNSMNQLQILIYTKKALQGVLKFQNKVKTFLA